MWAIYIEFSTKEIKYLCLNHISLNTGGINAKLKLVGKS